MEAVSIQKMNVPDLVVIDQQNQQQLPSIHQNGRSVTGADQHPHRAQNANQNNQPEAASLINMQDLNSANASDPHYITFECLISFDKRKDKNLIVKWHHEDRVEPIYQWIPELNKRSIAPRYMHYIVPIVTSHSPSLVTTSDSHNPSSGSSPVTSDFGSNQIQLLEAGFRMVRPSKELGGKFVGMFVVAVAVVQ